MRDEKSAPIWGLLIALSPWIPIGAVVWWFWA
jgi:hypothetical protein